MRGYLITQLVWCAAISVLIYLGVGWLDWSTTLAWALIGFNVLLFVLHIDWLRGRGEL